MYVAKHFLAQRDQTGADIVVGVGKRGGEIAGNAVQVGDGLFEGHAWFETADTVNSETCVAVIEQRIAPLADGHIDLGDVGGAQEEVEGGGNDADDGVVLAVKGEGLAKHIGRGAEFSLPQAGADDGERRSADDVFTGGEGSAHEWLNT